MYRDGKGKFNSYVIDNRDYVSIMYGYVLPG